MSGRPLTTRSPLSESAHRLTKGGLGWPVGESSSVVRWLTDARDLAQLSSQRTRSALTDRERTRSARPPASGSLPADGASPLHSLLLRLQGAPDVLGRLTSMLTGPDDGPGRELRSLLLDESAVAQVHELIK